MLSNIVALAIQPVNYALYHLPPMTLLLAGGAVFQTQPRCVNCPRFLLSDYISGKSIFHFSSEWIEQLRRVFVQQIHSSHL